MTGAQLLALRELATVFEDDKPALAEAMRAAITEIERLTEALRDVQTKLFERSAGCRPHGCRHHGRERGDARRPRSNQGRSIDMTAGGEA